jgi:adenylyltransferase/sulfurtransferase
MLTPSDFQRYQRQMLMPEIGIEGQQKLKNSRIFIAGMGGLGSAAALYLASSGIGTIGIADVDCVDKTNLHRQIIFDENDVGILKIDAARKKLLSINSNVEINVHNKVDENIINTIKNYDIIIDCTDNFSARYAINDACIKLKKYNIYASVVQFEGQLTVFAPGGPCYRCLHPTQPKNVATCSEVGILGALAGMFGTMQAIEAMKLVLGKGEVMAGKLLTFDALKGEIKYLKLPRRNGCVC